MAEQEEIIHGNIKNCPNCGAELDECEFDAMYSVGWWCDRCDWQGYAHIVKVEMTFGEVITTEQGQSQEPEPDPSRPYTDPGPTLPGFA